MFRLRSPRSVVATAALATAGAATTAAFFFPEAICDAPKLSSGDSDEKKQLLTLVFRPQRSGFAAAALGATSLGEDASSCDGETIQEKFKKKKKKRVLIVGCGLTGSLTAHQLLLNRSNRWQIDMVERATYPAGRFGARAEHGGAVADLGAQVLSTVNPEDPRALGGHGVTKDNLQTACSIVEDLVDQQLLRSIPDSSLGETEERMVWEGLWQHYVAPRGLSVVLESLVSFASVHKEFGVKVDSVVALEDNKKLRVSGLCRRPTGSCALFQKDYDAVVLCVSAPDVLSIQGVDAILDESSLHVLKSVGYDSRTCEAHFFDARLRPALARAFSGDEPNDNGKQTLKLELGLEDDDKEPTHNPFSFVSWQDPKQTVSLEDDATLPCALVVHGKVESNNKDHPQPLDEGKLDLALAKATGLSAKTFQQYRLHKKSIPWQISQMIRPMEAVVNDPPENCSWQCLATTSSSGGTLIVAGDFMTQSSFVGCVATADAAAQTLLGNRATSAGK